MFKQLCFVSLLAFFAFNSLNAQKKCEKLANTKLEVGQNDYKTFKNEYAKKINKYADKCLNKGVANDKKFEGPVLNLLAFALMTFEKSEDKKYLSALNQISDFKMPENENPEIKEVLNSFNISTLNNFLTKKANVSSFPTDMASIFPEELRGDFLQGYYSDVEKSKEAEIGLKVLFGLCGGNCTYEETFASIVGFFGSLGIFDDLNLEDTDSFNFDKLQDSIGL